MPAESDTMAAAPRDASEAVQTASSVPPTASARRAPTQWFALRSAIPARAYRLLALGAFATLFALWAWASHRESTNPVFVPSPEAVWRAARELFGDEKLWLDVRLSLFRVTAGFLLAGALGVPLGLWMGSFKVVEGLVQPLTEFVRYIPVPALIPILMVLFGIDELSKIMLIWVGHVLSARADGRRRDPPRAATICCRSATRSARAAARVVRPRALARRAARHLRRPPPLQRLGVDVSSSSPSWSPPTRASAIASSSSRRFLQTPKIWVYLIILGIIGLSARPASSRRLNRPLFHWAETERELISSSVPPEIRGARRPSSRRTARRRQRTDADVVRRRAGQFVTPARPVRLRQIDALYIVAGLEEATGGEVRLDGAPRLRSRARSRDGLPELHAVPLADRRGEHPLRAAGSTVNAAWTLGRRRRTRGCAARAHGLG